MDAKFGTVDAHHLGREQLIAEKTHFDLLSSQALCFNLFGELQARRRY